MWPLYVGLIGVVVVIVLVVCLYRSAYASDDPGALAESSSSSSSSPPLVMERPVILYTSPVHHETNVDIHLSELCIYFSQDINTETIQPETIFFNPVTHSSMTLSGAWWYDPESFEAIYVLDAPLLPGTLYEGHVTTSVCNTDGYCIPRDYVWTFETGL